MLIQDMAERCRRNGVDFSLLILTDRHGPRFQRVYETLKQRGIDIIDLSHVKGFYPNDGHPNPAWHRDIFEQMKAYSTRSIK